MRARISAINCRAAARVSVLSLTPLTYLAHRNRAPRKRMAFPDGRNPCSKCEQGYTDIYRLVVRSNAYGGQKYLIHAHRHENLQHILLRVCEQYPSEWTKDTVYYFYLDIGGAYYAVEHAFWLRGKTMQQRSKTFCERSHVK